MSDEAVLAEANAISYYDRLDEGIPELTDPDEARKYLDWYYGEEDVEDRPISSFMKSGGKIKVGKGAKSGEKEFHVYFYSSNPKHRGQSGFSDDHPFVVYAKNIGDAFAEVMTELGEDVDVLSISEAIDLAEKGGWYGEGGELKGEVKDMLMNQIKQVKHHADELTAVAKKSKNIEPWILTKTQRAATDLSDVTHYLDGELSNTKMEKGGEVKWQDAERGDSALVISENKMGVIFSTYGRKFNLKFPDGSMKTYDAKELRVMKEMKMGGETKFSDKVSAVSKRLEGTPVPAKYRKEYGKRYGKKTAQEAARKIVGARVAKYERMR